MNLLTEEIRKKLPPLYAQEGSKAIVHVKFFTPDSSWTWYATYVELRISDTELNRCAIAILAF